MSNSFSFLFIHNYCIIYHNIDLSCSPGSVVGSVALVPPYNFIRVTEKHWLFGSGKCHMSRVMPADPPTFECKWYLQVLSCISMFDWIGDYIPTKLEHSQNKSPWDAN